MIDVITRNAKHRKFHLINPVKTCERLSTNCHHANVFQRSGWDVIRKVMQMCDQVYNSKDKNKQKKYNQSKMIMCFFVF